MNLKEFFNQEGYDIDFKIDNDKNISLWKSWYKGNVKDFHHYWIYNRPGSKVRRKKRTLQMAKKVCEDWADLLFNEKVKISINNEQDQIILDDLTKMLKLELIVNQGIEKSFAFGTGALVLSIKNLRTDGIVYMADEITQPKIEFVEAEKIIPLTWDSEEITECAFINYKTEKGQKYIYISMHIKNELGNYVIKNYKFRYDNKQLNPAEDDGLLEEFDTGSDIAWYSIIKPNICNNIEDDTPFGISIFANSISVLMNIDDIYDSKDLEVTLGRRRTFISEDLLTYDDGKGTLVFDPNDISVYVLPKGFDKDMLIQSDNADLRTDKMIDDLNSELNVLSSKVGFGSERYRFDKGTIQTATGVISANSDMYRVIKKHEIVLETSILNIISALIYACNTFTLYRFSSNELKIDFDDSIVEDTGAETLRALNEVSQGLRSKMSYLVNIKGMSEDEARKELEEIKNEKMSNQEAFGFNVEE